jgi:hypothetical protein
VVLLARYRYLRHWLDGGAAKAGEDGAGESNFVLNRTAKAIAYVNKKISV